MKALSSVSYVALSLFLGFAGMGTAHAQISAQSLPGSADVGRIKPEQNIPVMTPDPNSMIQVPSVASGTPVPAGAENVHFTLRNVQLNGVTAFSSEQLQGIYAQYLGKEITLDAAYKIADEITKYYRDAGYFLSLAYVPNQKIHNGTIIITVVEGYIGKVEIDHSIGNNEIVQTYIHRLTAKKPLTSDEMESFLLRLNDLPGFAFSGVLSSYEHAEDGAVKLSLIPDRKSGKGTIGFDNYSSRFLGPNEVSASFTKSFLPLQQTSISGLTSVPVDELNYLSLSHSMVIAPDISVDVTGSRTWANPGYNLEKFDIDSDSTFVSTGLNYQWIRQRQQNLSLKLLLDARNSNTDLLKTPFVRDHIRAARVHGVYDVTDRYNGYNIASMTISQGIDGLGSSNKGDLNLSRAQAKPDFTKAELSLTRLQGLTDKWSVLMTAQGQHASGPLFSAEEFGYGGQGFGRAFDSSEITGDKGVAGSVELRYGGWNVRQFATVQPYAFYDMGKVWNDDVAQAKTASGSSTGIGVRATTSHGVHGNLGLAWPLSRDISTPIYGAGKAGPRILLQVSKDF